MGKLRTIKIKGKEYVEVKERIRYLAEEFEHDYSIETSYDYFPERRTWVVKATLTLFVKHDPDAETLELVYTGLAQEVESDDTRQVNYSSALENAETSAVGRACAMAGIGVVDAIASADEIRKAQNRGSNIQPAVEPPVVTLAPDAHLPWLTEQQFQKAKSRIEAGELSVLEKLKSTFRIKKFYADELDRVAIIAKPNGKERQYGLA